LGELNTIDSKFRLCILAAKRAKQIVHGSKKKVDINAENPLTIAIEEIKQGKINVHILEENEDETYEIDQDEFLDELDERLLDESDELLEEE
jgi:DNA-directed RNA polymerase subunit omega